MQDFVWHSLRLRFDLSSVVAELLKNRYSKAFIVDLADRVKAAYESFEEEAFVAAVMSKGWRALELKDRMKRISETLEQFLQAPR